MKKLFLLLTTSGILFFTSCKKDADIKFNFPPKPEKNTASSDNKLAEVFAKNAVKSESFSVNATTGGTVSTSKGSTYTLLPKSFVFKDGSEVTGDVDLKIKEITIASEMILSDKPTVTRDGSLLKSYGEFKVTAAQKNVEVFLSPKTVINVSVRQVTRDTLTGNIREIQMWDGDTIVNYTINGRDYENNAVTLQNQYVLRKGIDWTANNYPAVSNGSTINFPVDKLGEWRNCDILQPNSTATTLIGYFNNIYNDSSASNMLFFKIRGQNTIVKIYEPVLNPPAGKTGLISSQNRFNIGLQGTLIAMVYKSGKFYGAVKDITVGAPGAGKTFYGVDITLDELTEAQLIALVQSMNSK